LQGTRTKIGTVLRILAVAFLGCGTGCDDGATRQAEARYYQQLQRTLDDQDAEWKRQVKRIDAQDKRYEALMDKWEEHTERVDALLAKWEHLTAVLAAKVDDP